MIASSHSPKSLILTARNPPSVVLWAMRALCIIAFCIASYLAWTAFRMGTVAGCTETGIWSCDHVLHSRWAKVFGIPVSLPAAGLYVTLFVCLLFVGGRVPDRIRNLSWCLITVLAISAGSAAIWFTTLQVFVLKHLCMYCLAVHSLGFLACLLVLISRPLPGKVTSGLAGVGVLATGVLMVTQMVTEPPPTHQMEVYDQVAIDETPMEEVLDFSFDDGGFEMELEETRATHFVTPDAATSAAPLVDTDAELDSLTEDHGSLEDYDPLLEPTTPTSIQQPEPAAHEDGWDESKQSAQPLPTLTPQPPVGGPVVPPSTDSRELKGTKTASRTDKVKDRRLVMYPGVRANLNVQQWPILGSPQARHVVIELFDYTCPHCREMNRHIEVARERFGDQLAIVVMPVPLNRECNPTVLNPTSEHVDACEIARLALAVWRVDPDVFPVFHRWLFEADRNRTANESRLHAETLVPRLELQKQLQGPMVGKFINRHVTLYKRAGKGTLPKLLTEKMTIQGKMRTAEELCRTLQSQLGMTP